MPSKLKQSRDPEDVELKRFLERAAQEVEPLESRPGELELALPMPDIRVDFPTVMEEEERIPGDVERKDAAFKGYLESAAYRRFKAAADLWAAAFFWSPEVGSVAPTTEHYRRALNGEFNAEQAQTAQDLLEEFPAFHWPLRFPEIAARGGFDGFVGNPPWEQVKVQEQEWFAPRAPEIAEMTSTPRRAAIAALKQNNPQLWHQWRITKIAYDRLAEFMRNSGRYSSSDHEPNTYLLFAEALADAVRSKGRAGLILKSALGLDKSANAVLHKLIENGQLERFHDIINLSPFSTVSAFPAVDDRERFAIVSLRHASDDKTVLANFKNWSIEEARDRLCQTFTPDLVSILNPKTKTFTSFRHQSEFEIGLEIHRRALEEQSTLTLLDFEEGGSNPWELSYHTLFHSSGKSDSFLKREELEVSGWKLEDAVVFRRNAAEAVTNDDMLPGIAEESGVEDAVPLLEGQLINRYDHRARTYAGYRGADKYGRGPQLPTPDDRLKAEFSFEIEPRYWMNRKMAEARLRATIGDKIAMGFRDISSPNYQRSAKAALLPRLPATDTIPILAAPLAKALAFIGFFNSTSFDFFIRSHMAGPHVKAVWMLAQIPAPMPGTMDARVAENAAKLSLTSHSVARLFNRAPHRWDRAERHALDVEIDALVAHAYG